jgi:hypothetical protein
MAMEREWARKLNAAQLESLQKVAEAELYAKSKAAEAEQAAAGALELGRAAERIRVLEQADQEQQAASRRAGQQLLALERASQVGQLGRWPTRVDPCIVVVVGERGGAGGELCDLIGGTGGGGRGGERGGTGSKLCLLVCVCGGAGGGGGLLRVASLESTRWNLCFGVCGEGGGTGRC